MSSTRPFVSILIPCHNAERWISQAIESALAQTWPLKEVIVVDDGSTDGSLGVIKSFGSRIRWEAGANRGGNATRNRLLELAHGDWLQYLDADDYLKPDKVEQQVKAIDAHPDVDVLFGPVIVEWHAGDAISVSELAIPEPHDTWNLLAMWRLPQTGAPLWRRSAIEAVEGWAVDQPCCQEHELYLRLLIAGRRFQYHRQNGAVYRSFSDGTLSTRAPAMVRRERLKIEKRLEDHLAAIGELTLERQWAINQARFDMARVAWAESRSEARAILDTIKDPKSFHPASSKVPLAYRVSYRLFGFEFAERMAEINRIALRRRYLTINKGLRGAVD